MTNQILRNSIPRGGCVKVLCLTLHGLITRSMIAYLSKVTTGPFCDRSYRAKRVCQVSKVQGYYPGNYSSSSNDRRGSEAEANFISFSQPFGSQQFHFYSLTAGAHGNAIEVNACLLSQGRPFTSVDYVSKSHHLS